jgi:hypothetical protein
MAGLDLPYYLAGEQKEGEKAPTGPAIKVVPIEEKETPAKKS